MIEVSITYLITRFACSAGTFPVFAFISKVLSGVNTPNDYMGPGTGYRVEGKRWEEIKKIPHIINPQDI